MASLKASPIGCQMIKARRQEKDWRYRDPRWAVAAGKILLPEIDWEISAQAQPYLGVSETTMHRYQHGERIRQDSFEALSAALELRVEDIIADAEIAPDLVPTNRSLVINSFEVPRSNIFLGRQQEMQNIADWLEQGMTFLNIWGAPGIGKSSLAAAVIEQNSSRFEAAICSHLEDLVEPLPLDDFLEYLIGDLAAGVPDFVRTSEVRRDFYRLLFEHRILVVMDGHFSGEYRTFFERLVRTDRQSCLILVSESDLELVLGQQSNHLKKIKLEGLDSIAVGQLWQQLTGLDKVDIEESLQCLTSRYDGNPWMLYQAIDYVQSHLDGNLLQAMERTLAMFRQVQDLLEKRVSSRTASELLVLQSIASVEDEVSFEDIRSLTNDDTINYQATLIDLCNSTLVSCYRGGSQPNYSISSVLRKYLRQRPQNH